MLQLRDVAHSANVELKNDCMDAALEVLIHRPRGVTTHYSIQTRISEYAWTIARTLYKPHRTATRTESPPRSFVLRHS